MKTNTKDLLRPIARFLGVSVRETPDFTLLEIIPDHIRMELISLYKGEAQLTKDGSFGQMDDKTKISISQGLWLYNFCIDHKVLRTLEVGLAYGFSTLYFIALLAKHRDGHHTAVDPYANKDWRGIGLAKVAPAIEKLGLDPAQRFEFFEERSDHAAIDLHRRGSRFDLIFVDGNHRFDDVLVDFYLYDPLCRAGGFIVFDDMWMSSVRSVASFISSNRLDYARVANTHPNVAAFQKLGPDSRAWDHFVRFGIARRTGTEIVRALSK
jgi:predicted O-methyltransferase YrrM